MPKYRIRQGCKHYMRTANPEKKGLILYKGGDFIELTESQARNIMDKLEMVGATVEEAEITEKIDEKMEAAAPRVEALAGGKYNVLHAETGAVMNDKPLAKSAAAGLAGILVKELPVYEAPAADETEPTNSALEIKALADGGYDVLHPETGNPINESPLDLEAADTLAANWKLED